MTIDEFGVEIPDLTSTSTSVSMEDFNSLKSTMETKMDKLQEMVMKLLEAKDISSPPTTLSSDVNKSENEDVDGKNKGLIKIKLTTQLKHQMVRVYMVAFCFHIHPTYLSLILLFT